MKEKEMEWVGGKGKLYLHINNIQTCTQKMV
jgi:hypothetical protein